MPKTEVEHRAQIGIKKKIITKKIVITHLHLLTLDKHCYINLLVSTLKF